MIRKIRPYSKQDYVRNEMKSLSQQKETATLINFIKISIKYIFALDFLETDGLITLNIKIVSNNILKQLSHSIFCF